MHSSAKFSLVLLKYMQHVYYVCVCVCVSFHGLLKNMRSYINYELSYFRKFAVKNTN